MSQWRIFFLPLWENLTKDNLAAVKNTYYFVAGCPVAVDFQKFYKPLERLQLEMQKNPTLLSKIEKSTT
jgi:hypothetical protein